MRLALAAAALLCNGLDNLTTYACLTTSVPGVEMYEANPLAAQVFASIGLMEGLVLEMILCAVAVVFLALHARLVPWARNSLLASLAVLPGIAVVNNVYVMWQLGVAPF